MSSRKNARRQGGSAQPAKGGVDGEQATSQNPPAEAAEDVEILAEVEEAEPAGGAAPTPIVEVLDEAAAPASEEALFVKDSADNEAEDDVPDGDVEDLDDEDDEDEDLDGEDSLTFSNGVIEKIVAIAMRDVPGVIGMKGGWLNRVQDVIGVTDSRKGVTVEVTPEASVRVNISVLIEYGAYAPQVFEDVKKAVVKHVTGMTGLAVAGVNLRIEDVLTAEEAAARRRADNRQEVAALEAPASDGTADEEIFDSAKE